MTEPSRFSIARKAAGLTQHALHLKLGGDEFATMRTIKRWEAGAVPASKAQPTVAEALGTTAVAIWPVTSAPPPSAPASSDPHPEPTPGVPAGSGPGVPITAYLGTADHGTWRPTLPRIAWPASLPNRRTATIAIVTVAALAGGTAVVASGSDDSAIPKQPTARVAGPTPQQRASSTVASAIQRGDYDAAITAALSVRNTSRANEVRTQAVRILLERVDTAITARKLDRARTLLARAKTKYGDRLPDESADRYARIHKLEAAAAARDKARADAKKRAAEAKAKAKRRAAAARAAATPRPAPSTAQPAPSTATPRATTPSTPSPRTQASPAPQSSGGSSSGGSSGGGSSGTKKSPTPSTSTGRDPGIY